MSETTISSTFSFLRSLHQAFWLGFLNRGDLLQITLRQYENWHKYSDPTYNFSGLSLWEEAAMTRHFGHCRSLLVACAGGGREVLALVKKGFAVHAFDCCEPLARAASQLLEGRGLNATILVSLPDEVPEDLGQFDGAIVGWGGYMHIQGHDTRTRFLKELKSHLKAESPVLLSFYTREGDPSSMLWIRRIANTLRSLRGSRERVETGDSLIGTFDHHFTREEVEVELDASGLYLEQFEKAPYPHAVARVKADNQ